MTMRPVTYICALVLGAGAAAGLGCGAEGGSIERTDAGELQDVLDNVSSAISAGNCSQADARVTQVSSDVQNLKGRIPAKLQRNLEQGVSALQKATPGDCEEVVTKRQQQQDQQQTTETTVETTTTPEPADTATVDTTDTGATQPETTPSDTTTTTEPPTGGATPEPEQTPTPPADGDQGGSGGEQG